MYTVKPEFDGATVNYQNKKVVLSNKDLSDKQKAEMISSGLSRYFVDNPTIKREIPVVKLQVIKKGANGDAIEKSLNAAQNKAADAGNDYSKKTVAELKVLITEKALDAGTAKTKAEFIAVLEAADAGNA